MIAAIYARKSTEQNGVADDQKSVTRQVEHARAFAQTNGWTVDETCIFADDAISGAEFDRPGLLRLLNALKPRPSFQVLIMADSSRLGREMIQTTYTLQQITESGARVFFYLEGREAKLDSALEQIMQSLVAFGSAMQREQSSLHTRDTHSRKAHAGYVTGGTCFGYQNVEIVGTDGKRSHVVREIVKREAAVVCRIFQLCAEGLGLKAIAKTLNENGAPAPRSQQERPAGWAPSSIREALNRELYAGVMVWGRTRTKKVRGRFRQVDVPESEWVRVAVPHLRIVPAELWESAQAQMQNNRARYLRVKGGKLLGRAPGSGLGKYLLSGFLQCGVCGSSLEARTRSHGRKRAAFYGCAAHNRKGSSICPNKLEIPAVDAEEAVLASIESLLLDPTVAEEIAATALAELQEETRAGRSETLEGDLRNVETKLARLTEALTIGGDLASIVEKLRTCEAERTQLQLQLSQITRQTARLAGDGALRRQIDERIRDWRGLLRRSAEQGQQLLRRLIVGRLKVYPEADAKGAYYRFRGKGTLSRLLSGLVPECNFDRPQMVASPTRLAPSRSGPFHMAGSVLRAA